MEASVMPIDGRRLVYGAKGFRWDRAISSDDREQISEHVFRLPSWVDQQLGTDNLDVRKLEHPGGLYRLRVGAFRAVFQVFPPHVVLHRVFRRRNSSDYDFVASLAVVRSNTGLRLLETEPPDDGAPVPQTQRTVLRFARRDPVQNPLSAFSDDELKVAGVSKEALEALRRLPPGLRPDQTLARLGVERATMRLIAEAWNDPARYVGRPLDLEAVALDEDEASRRLTADYSLSSFVEIGSARSFLDLLEADIEDWMVYLHPTQRSAVTRPVAGPWRVRGGAGTGKTVVALHRARHLAHETGGDVLLTTFVNTLPRVWEELLRRFPGDLGGRISCRSVNSIAWEIYEGADGVRTIAEADRRQAIIRDAWLPRHARLGGLSEIGLADEIDYMLIGRSIRDLDAYLGLARTGRGTPLGSDARSAVWEAYQAYTRKMGKARLTYWPELRRDALVVLQEGRAQLSFSAVVADEAQDLGEASVLMLAELVGGLPAPNLTLVGDGQQAIYPGGFSLLQVGIDIRGRATVLRTNWRNTHAIWQAAQALIEGQAFDDLEEEVSLSRTADESPFPMREGDPPGLWVIDAHNASDLAVEVVAETREHGYPLGNTVLLAPTNAQAHELQAALRTAGSPVADVKDYRGQHQDVVWVGTFHRAKGLEFKHVVVTGLSAATWPPCRPGLDAQAQAEARSRDLRAAFVAMTRARDRLDVVVAGEPMPELEAAAWAFDRH